MRLGKSGPSTTASATINPAAIQYILRHPKCSPTTPLIVRDNKIPSSSPIMMIPITLPRRAGGVMAAAKGSNTCGTTVAIPIARLTIARNFRFGATAAATSATATSNNSVTTSRRGCTMSPIGTSSKSPSAYPICVNVGIALTPRTET